MNIPLNFGMWILAALPIVTLIVLMLKFQWSATKAAPLTLAVAVVTGVIFYKADLMLVLCESGKGIWNALTILLIVWTAILLYQVGNEANAFSVIRSGMRRLFPNELLLILVIGWVLGSFLQGITGFGVPVAVGAPLLIGIGVHPVWAVVISLLGQAWGNTFGTLAAAWDALVMAAEIQPGSATYFSTALWAALFICLWNVFSGFAVCWFYGKGKAIRKGFVAVLVIAGVQGVGEIILTQINTTLSCFIPSCVALIAVVILGKTKLYRKAWSIEDSPIMSKRVAKEEELEVSNATLLRAFVPYLVLSVVALLVLLVKPVNELLGSISFGPAFPETETGYGYVNPAVQSYSPLSPLTHASTFLLLSALIGILYYKKLGWLKNEQIPVVFKKSFAMTAPSGGAVICMVIMSRIMGGTGQTIILSSGITAILGKFYVVLAPFFGLLGSFMTGSNMSSNILFGGFQMTTANLLQVPAPILLGAQTAGGAIGSAISPSKIILGTTTANILGEEGKVLKKVFPITIPMTILMGIIAQLSVF